MIEWLGFAGEPRSDMDDIRDVLKRARLLEADHDEDGWPAIQMRDVTILRCEILELRAKLSTQQAGVRSVIEAAVNLVCAPSWAGISDEDVLLEAALRDAGFVKPNVGIHRHPKGVRVE